MSPSTLALSERILALLMPPAQAEALLGDLLEERRLRLQAGSRSQRRRLVLEAARLVRANLAVGLGAARRLAHHGRHRRRQLRRRKRHSVRALVRAVADDDVEVWADRRRSFLLRRCTGRLRVRRRVDSSRGGATARLPRVCHDMRDAGDQHARLALVRGVASRPRSGSHDRRRGSVRAATSCPPLAELLRCPPQQFCFSAGRCAYT